MNRRSHGRAPQIRNARPRGVGQACGLVTQPVLTRGLRQLEHQLGVVLLYRSAKGAALTPCGEALVDRAERINEELLRARDELRQMQGAMSSARMA
jgi:DNA-binding transcriptional LysR family regulator